MHCLLLQDTHEDLTFVKSLHIVLKYFPLPGPQCPSGNQTGLSVASYCHPELGHSRPQQEFFGKFFIDYSLITV